MTTRPHVERESPGAFPAPVPPCPSVDDARQQRVRELLRVTLAGILLRLLIIVGEFLGVAISGSRVLLVDAVASLFDVVASLVLLFAIRFAARPPDEDHPFGHGRAEPLAGFQLGLLLSGTGLWLALASVVKLAQAPAGPLPGWLWLIPLAATLALGGATAMFRRAAARAHSPALRAEAAHFQIDMWTSLLTTLTLLAIAYWPQTSALLDHLGGAALAVVMISLGLRAAWDNLHQLMDRAPREAELARVRGSALAVEGVIDVEKVRVQHAGPDAHVDIDIEVDPEISVDASHRIAQRVRARIQTDWPFVREVVVHVEPYYSGDH